MCSVATRLFISRNKKTRERRVERRRRKARRRERLERRIERDSGNIATLVICFLSDAESSDARRGSRPASRAPVAPRPRHREDDDERAGAGDDERRHRAGGGRFRFFLPTRPGCFSVRARRAFVVRRGHRRPVPRRVRGVEGDNARRKRGGGRQPGQGRPGRSRSRLENGARRRRRERRVRVSRQTPHGVGPLAERLVHAGGRGRRGERGDDALARRHEPRAHGGGHVLGGDGRESVRDA